MPEPRGAGTELRALAHDSGEPQGPRFGAGTGRGRRPVRHHLSGVHHEDVALVRPAVHLGFEAVEMLPPELLALPAVVARGRRHHGHGLLVGCQLPGVRDGSRIRTQALLLGGGFRVEHLRSGGTAGCAGRGVRAPSGRQERRVAAGGAAE